MAGDWRRGWGLVTGALLRARRPGQPTEGIGDRRRGRGRRGRVGAVRLQDRGAHPRQRGSGDARVPPAEGVQFGDVPGLLPGRLRG